LKETVRANFTSWGASVIAIHDTGGSLSQLHRSQLHILVPARLESGQTEYLALLRRPRVYVTTVDKPTDQIVDEVGKRAGK